MNNNDIYFDENPKYKETIKLKSFPKIKKSFKNIFMCPLNKNDCVNSIDIFDDIVLYGTIMGNVYLCRVNQNNLLQNKKHELNKKNNNNQSELDNSDFSNKNETQCDIKPKYKIDEKDTSKISCIKLTNNNIDNNSNNFINQNNGNETLRTNKNESNKQEKLFYDSDIIPTTKSGINNLKNNKNKSKKKLININILENKNDKSDKSIIDNESLIKKSAEEIPFPQVTQLISNATENIPCVSFDTKDKVNISIGDYEIIRLENMSSFNINDDNSNYNYIRIRNYQSENEHIKCCENSTCMMTDKNFLLVHTNFGENTTPIIINNVQYENKTFSSYEVIKGEIEMYNYSIPFDFDGDKFLFLDYESDKVRRICIYYTLSKKPCFIYKLTKDFGHISYMKLLFNDRIILVKNQKICEIRQIDEDFKLLETWEHDGNEIIAMNVYIEGKGENDSYFSDTYSNLSVKNHNENESQTVEIKKLSSSQSKNKSNYNNKRKPYKKDNINNSTIRDLKSSQRKSKEKILDNELINNNNRYLALNYNSNIEEQKNKLEKENIIEIYNKYKAPSIKDNDSANEFKKKKLSIYSNENSMFMQVSQKELIVRNKSVSNFIKNKNKPNERSFSKNEKKIFIITVDLNGNFSLYHNKKIKTIFNLYEINNIDKIYKEEEFFALGFPYYVTMNSKYIAITTDHGVFVLSNKV